MLGSSWQIDCSAPRDSPTATRLRARRGESRAWSRCRLLRSARLIYGDGRPLQPWTHTLRFSRLLKAKAERRPSPGHSEAVARRGSQGPRRLQRRGRWQKRHQGQSPDPARDRADDDGDTACRLSELVSMSTGKSGEKRGCGNIFILKKKALIF